MLVKIFTGASWAVGEFGVNGLSGPGIMQYTAMHDQVVNLCKGASSSYSQIIELNKFLTRFRIQPKDDSVYWLVHSPLVGVPLQPQHLGQQGLAASIEKLLIDQLLHANAIAEKYKITINLIGAACDLDSINIDQFKNLNMLVPSWGKLLDESYPSAIFSHQSDEFARLKIQLEKERPDLISEYERISGMAFRKRKFMLTRPDKFASFHPTSRSHRQLRDHLFPEWAHIF
jgi:hypothetical protein